MTHEEFSMRFQGLFYDGADQIAAGVPAASVQYQVREDAKRLVERQLNELDARRSALGNWTDMDTEGKTEYLDIQNQWRAVKSLSGAMTYMLKWFSYGARCRGMLDSAFSADSSLQGRM